ncbi:MAG: radical SAM protein [Chitinispirillaceae bacterium]|nr:radical SAM protein [Chitinispirillaceae bacterium]
MHYTGTIIRPPSEADSILLQVTTGCSHNRCTFCGAYKDTPFSIRDDTTILEDILEARSFPVWQDKVFLCDGDAMILPQKKLIYILDMIRKHLPHITRAALYANAKSISRKSDKDLQELYQRGLKMVHLGLESGDDSTLASINKWGDSESIIRESKRIIDSGMQLFVTVLSGIAQKERSLIHAEKTGTALSRINPRFVGALTVMPVPGTVLYDQLRNGSFILLTPEEILLELKTMIACTDMSSGYFYANHASNYLPLRIKMPRGKQLALSQIEDALSGRTSLKPEFFRGL